MYAELRTIAHRSRVRMGGNPTLHTTAVVNEAYIKLKAAPAGAENSAHFLSIAAKAMRQIIIDYARSRKAGKRGGDVVHVDIEKTNHSVDVEAEQLLIVNDALEQLESHSPRLAKVFELKFFIGLDDDELAAATGRSKRSAQRDWMKARAYLGEYLYCDD